MEPAHGQEKPDIMDHREGGEHHNGVDQEDEQTLPSSLEEPVDHEEEVHEPGSTQDLHPQMEDDDSEEQDPEILPTLMIQESDLEQAGHVPTQQDPGGVNSLEVIPDLIPQQSGSIHNGEVSLINPPDPQDQTSQNDCKVPPSVVEVKHQLDNGGDRLMRDNSLQSDGRKLSSSSESEDDFFDAEDQLNSLGMGDPQPDVEDASKFKTAREGDLQLWEQSLREAAGAKTRVGHPLPGETDLREDSGDTGKSAINGGAVKIPAAKGNSDLWENFEPDSVVLVDKSGRDGEKVPPPYRTLSTVSSSTSLVSQQSAPPGQRDWVLFDEGPTKRSHSSMGGVTGPAPTGAGYQLTDNRTDWVKFESSPRAKRRQITLQFTGDSLTNSIDTAMSTDGGTGAVEADGQSMATPSVISSHGSYSDHQEYFPLEASSASSVSRLSEMPRWSEQGSFEGGPIAPPRRRSGINSTSPPPSDSRVVPSPIPQSWVQFEDGNSHGGDPFSSSRSSPTHSLPRNVDPSEARLASRATLPSRTILATDIASIPPEAVLQDITNRSGNSADLHFTEPSALPSSPSPANPFREDILRQQREIESRKANGHRRQGSYNPFKADIPEEMPQPTSTWQTFSDDPEPPTPSSIPSSPGNPFKFQTHVEFHQPFQRMPDEIHSHQTVSQSQPVDEPDFGLVPSSPTVLVEIRDKHSPVLGDFRASQFSRTMPTATVAPVLKSAGMGANALPDEVGAPSVNGYVNEYPRTLQDPEQGWALMLRYPDKKKWAGSREWKSVHVRLIEGSLLQFFNNETETEPFKEIPLQCNYEFTPLKLYPYDTMGKVHTIKLLYTTYKEKWKLSARSFHTRVLITEQLLKVGSRDYESFRSFVFVVNEALMRLSSFKGRDSHYHNDQVTVTVIDSYRNLTSTKGDLLKQSSHVDIYMLAFLSGKAECAIGLNDIQVKGTEVVSKREIIPNKTTEWIKMENIDLHKCCNKNVFSESRFITFDPIDACRFKLLSFDVKPKASPELPLLVKAALSGEDVHIQFRVDLLVPARGPKREPHHYICYDIMIRIPVPPSLISYFRCKKRIGFSSVKAVHKTAEQIKKPRIKPGLLEVSVGSAKYEHAFEAIVWRIDKLPEKISAVPATHLLLCTLNLSSGRNYSAARLAIPSEFENTVKVDYRTHQTTASSTTVRSLAVDSEKSPDKIIRYLAQYEYTVLVDNTYARGPMADGIDDPQCAQQ